MKFKELNITRFHRLCLIYTFTLLLIGGISNYYTWTEGAVERINLLSLLLWIALYVPLFISRKYDYWEIKEFGFIINNKTLLFLSIFLIIIFLNKEISLIRISLKSAFLEVFARTGEELFFRGFLYALFLKMFNNEKKPWIWAVILSSILFAMVHTQTFLPEYSSNMFDIFMIGFFLALLRKYTESILLGMLIHILIKSSDVLSSILGIALYFVFVFIAYYKKERVFQIKLFTRR